MDRMITIRQVSVVQGPDGADIETWSDLASVWAKVRPARGRENTGQPGIIAEADTVFTIWHRADVTRRMEIRYDGDDYDIKSINELGRREGLEIHATAQVT
jgi:SPP1 family predicted phage head-tail adaptor